MEDGTCNVVCFNSLKHIESFNRFEDGLLEALSAYLVPVFFFRTVPFGLSFPVSFFFVQALISLQEGVLFFLVNREGMGLLCPGLFHAQS